MWSAFSQVPAASKQLDSGYLTWFLLLRFLAAILLPRFASGDKDSAFLFIKIKEESRIVADSAAQTAYQGPVVSFDYAMDPPHGRAKLRGSSSFAQRGGP
ncbi:hypothetical protein BDV98DRAFT_571389 [Pterulicium gracile]|uniref:Uncharacterized protein n=1 Tax=Pterulicium gracile TaxID=1884261 RepID=A0A5C3QDR6_9AGAR|nr:hypothetical protein BDV98DRAFT_571389 [Pterula gracilis]